MNRLTSKYICEEKAWRKYKAVLEQKKNEKSLKSSADVEVRSQIQLKPASLWPARSPPSANSKIIGVFYLSHIKQITCIEGVPGIYVAFKCC